MGRLPRRPLASHFHVEKRATLAVWAGFHGGDTVCFTTCAGQG